MLLGAAVALSLGLPGAALAQRTPAATIVVVDTDRIYRDCNACRTAQTQLQTLGTQLQQRAQALGQPIETELQSIQTAANAARSQSGAARTAAETALQQRATRLDQQRNQAQQELARLEQNLRSTQANVIQQINARLNPIINQVMTQRGANLAVDVNATLAHAGTLNVTDQVLQQLNAALPSVTVAPLPAGQQPAPAQPGR
jgi:Skp family chaperone for outer membrane proteins